MNEDKFGSKKST